MTVGEMAGIKARPVEILMVEDNPGDVRLTQEALKEGRLWNHLTVTKDGMEAMEYLRRSGRFAKANFPDLVLLDLNLPKKDGREVLAEIKSDEKLKLIPVVILTTSRAKRTLSKAIAARQLLHHQARRFSAVRVGRAVDRGFLVHRGETADSDMADDPIRVLLVEDNPADAPG